MEKVLILMIALSIVASATAAEKKAETTPAPEMAMDCSTITDPAAKKDCESKAKTEAPVDTKAAPATK